MKKITYFTYIAFILIFVFAFSALIYASNNLYPQILLHMDTNVIDNMKKQIVINEEIIKNHIIKIDKYNDEIAKINKLYRKGRMTEEESDLEYNKIKKEQVKLNDEIIRLTNVITELKEVIKNKETFQSVNLDEIVNITDDKRRKEIIDAAIENVIVSHVENECTLKIQSKLINGYYISVKYNRKKDRKKIYQLNPINNEWELIPINIILDRWHRKYKYEKKK